MGPQFDGHVGGHLVGRGFRHAVGDIRDVLLRRPERDVHDQPAPAGDHRPCRQLARVVVRAHSCAEHRVPAPERLFPERLAPRECPVLDHPLVSAPDVVHEDVDPVSRLERRARTRPSPRIQPVVAANTGDVLIDRCTIVHRAAGHEHPRPVVSERARDPAADAEGPPGDDGDPAFQGIHDGEDLANTPTNCQERDRLPVASRVTAR